MTWRSPARQNRHLHSAKQSPRTRRIALVSSSGIRPRAPRSRAGLLGCPRHSYGSGTGRLGCPGVRLHHAPKEERRWLGVHQGCSTHLVRV